MNAETKTTEPTLEGFQPWFAPQWPIALYGLLSATGGILLWETTLTFMGVR